MSDYSSEGNLRIGHELGDGRLLRDWRGAVVCLDMLNIAIRCETSNNSSSPQASIASRRSALKSLPGRRGLFGSRLADVKADFLHVGILALERCGYNIRNKSSYAGHGFQERSPLIRIVLCA